MLQEKLGAIRKTNVIMNKKYFNNEQSGERERLRGQSDYKQNYTNYRGRSAIFADVRTMYLDWDLVFEEELAEEKCYRCWQFGHYWPSCLLENLGLWFCGACNRVSDHISKTCPNPRLVNFKLGV